MSKRRPSSGLMDSSIVPQGELKIFQVSSPLRILICREPPPAQQPLVLSLEIRMGLLLEAEAAALKWGCPMPSVQVFRRFWWRVISLLFINVANSLHVFYFNHIVRGANFAAVAFS
ncbi:hypothetical protein ACFXTN_014475 [Malus domestica]